MAASAGPDFARDVLPILERSCYGCHGPEKQKSGYRLDIEVTADFGHRCLLATRLIERGVRFVQV